MREIRSLVIAIAAMTVAACSVAESAEDHFHPKGNPPSEHTKKVLQEAKATLPLSDIRDFDEQKKGFIAAPDFRKIAADAGHTAWDMERYDFLLEGSDFDSIHPSQERQAKLNMNYGLYEVGFTANSRYFERFQPSPQNRPIILS